MKPVVITPRAWYKIRDEIHKEYPKSIIALRSKMRAVLGFTMREHRVWVVNQQFEEEYRRYQAQGSNKNDPFVALNFEPDKGHYEDQVHLDFYSDNKRTMFLLKYSDIINTAERRE